MAISVTCDVDDEAPAHGQIITFTYAVDGNDPVPSVPTIFTGAGVVGGVRYETTTTLTAPATPAASESFEVPVCDQPGWTAQATSDPHKFTCTVP